MAEGYVRMGHLAIFLGRFFPFIRTFVPLITGLCTGKGAERPV